jgi:hypothetical protein
VNDLPPDSIAGRLFVTSNSLIFSLYDVTNDTYTQAFKALARDITRLTVYVYGIDVDLRVETNGVINNFDVVDGMDHTGREISGKDVIRILVARYNAKVVP